MVAAAGGMKMETIIIERIGVVYFWPGYETVFSVDKVDLLEELADRLEASAHSTDYDGRFAGRVKIVVEFHGDLREE